MSSTIAQSFSCSCFHFYLLTQIHHIFSRSTLQCPVFFCYHCELMLFLPLCYLNVIVSIQKKFLHPVTLLICVSVSVNSLGFSRKASSLYTVTYTFFLPVLLFHGFFFLQGITSTNNSRHC